MPSLQQGVVRKHKPDYMILLFMGIIMMVGLVMIYSIGHQRANVLNNIFGTNYPEDYFFFNQLTSVAVAVVAFFAAFKVPPKLLKKIGAAVLVAGIAACLVLAVAALVSGGEGNAIANCTYGACRWINVGSRSFQPAELLKLGLLIYLAIFLGARGRQGKVNESETLLPLAIVSGIALFFIVVLQRDLGTGVVVGALVLSMLVVAGVSKKILILIMSAAVVLGLIMTVAVPHRRERLMTFLGGDSSSIEDDDAYHVTNAKIAIGTGGLLGVGIGNSVQATGYLPESINDSVFAIMGETFGFVGLLVIIGLFVILLSRLLKVTYFLHNSEGRILVAGVFGWIAAHMVMNIAAMIGLMPLTGITLPFLSYGGTSMMFVAAALGMAFGMSRYTAHSPVIEGKESDESSSSRRRVGRPRYASRRSS
ncbi:MAG: FtsW/RodA/SpoVE family cell cycle protein [Candidatus Nomurabacteria bacterium]|jgi:cell division protein FtsW|nr:FtsW/RodA/SpoVE family cell cycle protein [Candidatus Nomurabacteria bacterium]